MSVIKTNEILTHLLKRGGITVTPEMQKVLDTENLSEIPADWWEQLSPQIIGLNQAEHNTNVFSAVKKKVLTGIEKDFDAALQGLGFEYEQLVGEKPSTFQKRLEALQKLDGVYAAKYKTEDGDKGKSREAIEQLTREKQELAKQVANLQTGFETERQDWQINSVIQSELSKYEFAAPNAEVAADLKRIAAEKIRKSAVFKLEGDSVKLYNPENPELPLTGASHEAIDIGGLVQSKAAIYVKKSDPKTDPITGVGVGNGGGGKTIEPVKRG